VHFVHRHMIEGRRAEAIAADLIAAFEKYCHRESGVGIRESEGSR
jgi:hypothetical protein